MTDEEACNILNEIIKANPEKYFSWKIKLGKHELMTGVFYSEWMEWTPEHRLDFVKGLNMIGFQNAPD